MARKQRTLPLGERPREWLPVRRWLPRYQRRWLKGDLIAGAVVAALAVPQSLGYATIAGLPVQVGLYSMPTVLLAYALLGTSRQLIVGPVSTVAVLTGSLIAGFAPANEGEAMALAAGMAIGAGVILMLASVLHIGWVAEFLSKPIVTGFVLGLTILVIVGELPNILGIPVAPGGVLSRIGDLASGLGEVQAQTAAVGLASLAILFAGARFAPRVPWALVVLVGGLGVSAALGLADSGVAVVGTVPQGLPTPALPALDASQFGAVLGAGAAVAFVGLAEGLSAARLFATQSGDRIDANQDLLAFGVGNVSSGVLGGFGVAGSLSKTAAAARSGGRTQMTGITTAVLALVVIMFIAPVLSDLPKAVLSAIVIHAVWGLMDFAAMRRYARLRRNDITAAVAATVGVLAFGPLPGLGIAIAMSVLGLVYRSSRVDVEVMGRIPGEKAAWGGMRNHPERKPADGILVLRVDVPLFWVNATSIKDAVLARVDGSKQFVDEDIVALVLDIEGTNQLDTTTVDMLDSLLGSLRERSVDLYIVRVMYPVRIILRHAGFVAKIGEDHMWHSISQGVRQARLHYGLKEGVADVGGGYESAEEHEPRIIPHYFADYRKPDLGAGGTTGADEAVEAVEEYPGPAAQEAARPKGRGRRRKPPKRPERTAVEASAGSVHAAQVPSAATSTLDGAAPAIGYGTSTHHDYLPDERSRTGRAPAGGRATS